MAEHEIVIKGAREHNLRGVDLRLPKDRLIVMTGVSGSGKSSLAFDTLYAEGQRRYVESLSSYARQFLGQLPKPEVDSITGLSPSISIQQKTAGRNPRSTVGTITEIFDYLRVLFARVGQGHCPTCNRPITAQAPEQIIDSISRLPEATQFTVLAPLIQRQKGEYRDLFEDLLKRGFVRARVDGRIVQLGDDIRLDKQMKHTIDVVVDRLTSGKTPRTRLAEAVESALKLADGRCVVAQEGGTGRAEEGIEKDEQHSEFPVPTSEFDRLYSAHYACTHCGISYEPPSPQLFSFNSPQGMCLDCNGLGERFEFVMDRLIPDESESLWNGAIELLGPIKSAGQWRKHIYSGVAATLEHDFGLESGSLLKSPWNELPDNVRNVLLNGLGSRQIVFEWKYANGQVWRHPGTFAGLLPELLTTYSKTRNPAKRKQLEKYMEFARCSSCGGTRLCAQARSVTVTTGSTTWRAGGVSPPVRGRSADSGPTGGLTSPTRLPLALNEVCALSIQDAYDFFEQLELGPTEQLIACEVLKEIRGRLSFLLRCGLDYLTLDRAAPTLSGGETQRIRLAGQIGCGLVGVVYILDEPSIGLHPRDNQMLLDSLCELRDQGNTVIVVEHDDETMRAADHIVDFGPGPGVRGGRVVAEGSYDDVLNSKESVTAAYLSGRRVIDVPSRRIGVERAAVLRVVELEEEKGRKGEGGKKSKRVTRPESSTGVTTKRELTTAVQTHALRKASGRATPANKQSAASLSPHTSQLSTHKHIRITGATHHNLKDVSVNIPLEAFVCVTGVSGSGKSSLINDILWQVLNRELNKGDGSPGPHRAITGLEHLDKAIDIDQSPIGRTPRSNPATYVKVFDLIRDLYTNLPDSKRRGYKPGRFSFNVSGGRCEACEGNGSNKLEMDFLADLWVTCPVCGGHRFNHETLEVKFKDLSIADVLELDVQQALKHFENVAPIARLLQTLHDVGLDYLKLGQPSPTLSGGEAQRIKLARELGKRSTGRTVYLLDEPTTGLHFADIHRLLDVLHGFVNSGNTVIVVEHNLDVIKTADWLIDLGPEGGAGGGQIVCCGTPEEVGACEASHTGRALQAVLDSSAPLRLCESKPSKKGSRKGAETQRTIAALSPKKSKPDGQRVITIKGAAQHNLQHIDLTIPRDTMNVFCGPSGSGKTSLAMDTLYAEGQRRYVESLSSYARQFLGQMPKPKVEHIHGLSPAIAIEQKTTGSTPRSTVGTVTEIYDYLRILWCRLGTLHCPDCGIAVTTQTTDEVIDSILAGVEGLGLRVEGKSNRKKSSSPSTLLILAPQEVKVGEKYERLWDSLRTRGFARVRIDGQTYRLDEVPEIDRKSKHVVEVVVDRVKFDGERQGVSPPCSPNSKASSEDKKIPRRANALPLAEAQNFRSRLAGSVEQAFDIGRGFIRVAHVDDSKPEEHWRVDAYSLHNACRQCGRGFEELTPHNFSFNSPLGWCPTCEGLGVQQGTDMARLVHEPRKSLAEGAVTAWPSVADSPLFRTMLETMATDLNIPLDVPFDRLDPRHKRVILHGAGERWFAVTINQASRGALAPGQQGSKTRTIRGLTHPGSPAGFRFQYKGLYPAIEEAGHVSYSYRQQLFGMTGEVACSACDGSRLRDDAANMRLRGFTLQQLCELPLSESFEFLQALAGTNQPVSASRGALAPGRSADADQASEVGIKHGNVRGLTHPGSPGGLLKPTPLSVTERKIAGDLLAEATHRLRFLVDVGLTYLSLARTLPTLSGGECQRIRLAGQIGRALTGVLYVLDEPTIGLHPRDNGRLLDALKKLRDLGNTLVLVEHDREVLGAADRLYDFGPGAGRLGGTVTAEGAPKQIGKDTASLTGQFLSGKREIPIPATRRMASAEERESLTRSVSEGGRSKRRTNDRRSERSPSPTLRVSESIAPRWLELTGARHNNLRNVHLKIPLGTLTVVTGVSGSGKSSLIQETLAKAIARQLHRLNETPGPFDELIGLKQIDKLIMVDQQPLGSTPKSNPGTFTGVFDHIRDLFAQLPESKVRGYASGRFSFNRSGGRCEPCEGNGQKLIEMHFLPDVWIECDQCRGKRYNAETLSVKYRGHSIADVLDMPIGKSLELFDNVPRIRGPLATLCAVGLDYLTLGQSAPTLSGGEAQRVKLAAELARPQTGKTLYILDEPTTGLHFDDIDKLLKVLNSLVEKGNTVVVIEHNLDVIKTADWLIDLGPEAGDGGGWIVAEGTPEEVVFGQGLGVRGQGSGAGGQGLEKAEGKGQKAKDNQHISHTAIALAPILAAGKRAEREIFDSDAARKRRQSDMRLSDLSREVKNPWEVDGRKWHTVNRVAKNGKPCRWDGEILARVIDLVEEVGESLGSKRQESQTIRRRSRETSIRAFKSSTTSKRRRAANEDDSSQLTGDDEPMIQAIETSSATASSIVSDQRSLVMTNWSRRDLVEVFGPLPAAGPFVQVGTDHETILSLTLRTPRGTFRQEELQQQLGLKPFLAAEGFLTTGHDRLKITASAGPRGPWGPMQEVRLSLSRLDEIDRPEFWTMLRTAAECFLRQISSR